MYFKSGDAVWVLGKRESRMGMVINKDFQTKRLTVRVFGENKALNIPEKNARLVYNRHTQRWVSKKLIVPDQYEQAWRQERANKARQ